LGYVLQEEANSEMRMRFEGSGGWGVIWKKRGSGLNTTYIYPCTHITYTDPE